jgi:hypothetical protein
MGTAKFKAELRKRKDISQVPKHYEIGLRKLNIIIPRLYFELMVELSHKDTWVHYNFAYYKTFVIYSFFFFLPMIPSLTLYKLKLDFENLILLYPASMFRLFFE